MIAAPGELVQLLTANGESIRPPYQVTVLPNGERQRAIAAGSGSATQTIDVGGRRMRLVTSHVGSGEALQIARPLADDDATLRRLRYGFAIVAVCALVLSLMIGSWVAEKALSPVRRLTRAAEDVARTRDLSVRLDAKGDDEIARLGAAFNEMLEALDRSLTRAATARRRRVARVPHAADEHPRERGAPRTRTRARGGAERRRACGRRPGGRARRPRHRSDRARARRRGGRAVRGRPARRARERRGRAHAPARERRPLRPHRRAELGARRPRAARPRDRERARQRAQVEPGGRQRST